MRLSVHPIWWWPLLTAGGVVAVVGVAWLYRQALASQSGRWRAVAAALRLAALLMTLAALFRPSVVFVQRRRQSASLVMLYDRSRSMLVSDAWDSNPRWRALSYRISEAAEPLQRVGEVLNLRHFGFDSKLTELPGTEALESAPDGTQTAIGDALRQALRQVSGRVAAVMLFSDGANTSGTPPRSVAQELRDRAIPLYCVGFGQETAAESARDLAMQSISAGPTVFEKNKLVARGELAARGFGGQSVVTRLRFGASVVDTRTVDLPPRDGVVPVELGYVPPVPGEYKVTLEVAEQEPKKGELVESNNQVSTYVTVLKGGLGVLYLDGGLGSWEPRFVRQALDSSPDVQLDLVLCRGPLAQEAGAPLFDRARYDVFLIRDVPRGWLPDEALGALRSAVEAGAGFAMLGGRHSFGPGGYADTPVAEVLPVVIHPGDPQVEQAGEEPPIRVVPTAQGIGHFVLRFGDVAETKGVWERLAPWPGASAFSRVKPRALVLATSPAKTPLIVAWEFGQGRAMAIAGDATWRWHLQSDQGLRYHRRFWRQVILWLAHKEHAGEERVWLELAQRRLRAGQGLQITAGAEDEQGMPVLDADFQATVVGPDGNSVPLKLVRYGDRAQATFWQTNKPGDYRVRVTATRAGQTLGRSPELKFLVYQEEVELAAPAANLELLASMAETTGGRYLQPEQLPEFLNDLRRQDLHLEIERLTHYRLWDNWYYLLAFVAMLTAEWAVRKWKGLV